MRYETRNRIDHLCSKECSGFMDALEWLSLLEYDDAVEYWRVYYNYKYAKV